MKVAGIDVSTLAIDIVTLNRDGSGAPEWHRHKLGADRDGAIARSRRIPAYVPGPASTFWDDVCYVAIEDPQMRGSSVKTAYSLYRVQGYVLACVPLTMPVRHFQPAQWRKGAGIAGNAPKADVKRRSSELHPSSEEWPQDAHDAHLIARALVSALDTERDEVAA